MKPVRERIAIAEAEGATHLSTEHAKRHTKLTFIGPQGQFVLFACNSPSDRRGLLAFRADVRRALRGV